MYTPEAFAPEVDQFGTPEEGSDYNEDRVYATDPKYPLTTTAQDTDDTSGMTEEKQVGPSTVGKLSDEELLVANFGPDDDGFEVCTQCGAVGKSGGLNNTHNRPYPKDRRFIPEDGWDNQCSGGSTVITSFSHTFNSDLTVLRIPLYDQMQYVPSAKWLETSGQSLAEALVMGSSRALGIEDNELEGGFRTRSAEYIDNDDAHGLIEIFLFDTTAGGAGFSSKVWDQFDAVLDETRSILEGCTCDSACHTCLRRYGNRHLHDSLNRHQGLALLDYAETGDPPVLDDEKVRGLVDQLERSLQLKEQDIQIAQSVGDSDIWVVESGGKSLSFSVRSCLRTSRAVDSAMLDEDYSDYELTHRLPEVAYSIVDQLE
jgi:hypothetical protein